jgi:hypothetical protein
MKRFTSYLCAIFGTRARPDMIHNISKNWIQRIYRFWDVADIGFSHFYFSCSKCPESDHVSIKKVVVFFTTKQKNWVCNFLNFLRFSTHFTSFCKLQTLLKINFASKSLERFRLSQIGPWFALNSLGPGGGRSWDGEHTGVGVRRRAAAAAEAARAPARRAYGVDNAWPWEVPRILGEGAEQSTGGDG